jgi:hypothetical protein
MTTIVSSAGARVLATSCAAQAAPNVAHAATAAVRLRAAAATFVAGTGVATPVVFTTKRATCLAFASTSPPV